MYNNTNMFLDAPLSTQDSPNYFFPVFFVVSILALRKLWGISSIQLDPQEPPLLYPRIPYVGHLLGMMNDPHHYFFKLHKKTKYPIATLPVLGGKVYVINSPQLVQAAFRNKTLSLAPLVNEYVGRMHELSPSARRSYAEDGMHERMMQVFTVRMSGESLKKMNHVAMREMNSIFGASFASSPREKMVMEVDNVWLWLRNIMTVVTTTTLLGRQNPWKKDSSLIEAYWNWESGDISRRTPLAAIKDRASHQGQTAIREALNIYFAEEHDADDISPLTFDTVAMQKQYGFSTSDLAAAYTQVIHASLMNAVPTAFWVMVHIYSRPELLASLREETFRVVKQQSFDNGERHVFIEIDQLDSLCPKLMSVFREAHRLASIATLHRRVVEDTFVSEGEGPDTRTYLLKKGITIMIPTTVSLRDPRLWGGAAAEAFDPERFLRESRRQHGKNSYDKLDRSESVSNLLKKAYFPFGGGKELCPGRSFAIAEVMGMMVVLLNGFDITSTDGEALPLPQPDKPKLTTGTARPNQSADLRARIMRRPGWENVVWSATSAPKGNYPS